MKKIIFAIATTILSLLVASPSSAITIGELTAMRSSSEFKTIIVTEIHPKDDESNGYIEILNLMDYTIDTAYAIYAPCVSYNGIEHNDEEIYKYCQNERSRFMYAGNLAAGISPHSLGVFEFIDPYYVRADIPIGLKGYELELSFTFQDSETSLRYGNGFYGWGSCNKPTNTAVAVGQSCYPDFGASYKSLNSGLVAMTVGAPTKGCVENVSYFGIDVNEDFICGKSSAPIPSADEADAVATNILEDLDDDKTADDNEDSGPLTEPLSPKEDTQIKGKSIVATTKSNKVASLPVPSNNTYLSAAQPSSDNVTPEEDIEIPAVGEAAPVNGGYAPDLTLLWVLLPLSAILGATLICRYRQSHKK